MWGNQLHQLDALSLGGLWNLRRLDLDRNQLTAIGKDSFRHLLELHSLPPSIDTTRIHTHAKPSNIESAALGTRACVT